MATPGAPPLTISGDHASALFWGESAVEKFLISYYASVAADDAPRFLERLFDAWYGYPAELVQVCAVAYLCGRVPPPDGTQLSLSRTVGLVCLEGGSRLRLLTRPAGWVIGQFTPRDQRDMLVTIAAEDELDLEPCLDRVTAPSLVLGGTADGFYTRDLFERTAAGIPRGRAVVWEGRSHVGVAGGRVPAAVALGYLLAA